ncbi:MAG TPA: zf-HC2 domain-containing protein [Candidatus Polarisedimenticolia bacterium]|jgi:hypothetical protein
MMTCADVRPILSLFLEKETGPLETMETRRHLDGCDSCRSRAGRLSGVLGACAALASEAPPMDVASSVMERLRRMRASMSSRPGGAAKPGALAARWSGLVVLLGAAMAFLAYPGAGGRGAIGRSRDYLAALLSGNDPAGRSTDFAGGTILVALKALGGGFRTELPAGAGLDLILVVNLVATSLLIALLLALPVAALTAWFLRKEARRRF